MGKRDTGGGRPVTRRTVILAGAPQYAGVAMSSRIVPALAQASTPVRDDYLDAVGHEFEAASETGRYGLTLSSVECLAGTGSSTRFGLMFTATTDVPPAGVYRLSPMRAEDVDDAQLFVAGSGSRRRASSRRPSTVRFTGRRP